MPGPSSFPRLAIAALLLGLASLAQAQLCGALPKVGQAASGAEPTERFRMISSQCGALTTPMKVHRAAQMDLYDKPGGVAITLPADPAASAPMPAEPASAPRTELKPLPRAGERVLTLAPALTDAAREHQVDPLLLHAIAHVESRHNADAKSKAGARGVMQVMPATGQRFGVADPQRALLNAEINVRAGAAYLRTLHDRYGDDLKRVLAAYNAGEGAVAKHGGVPPYRETQNYVRDVTAVYRRLREEFTAMPGGDLRRVGDAS